MNRTTTRICLDPQRPFQRPAPRGLRPDKRATEGDVAGMRRGMLDRLGRAKYDAWGSRRGMHRAGAMKAYVDLVDSLARSQRAG